MIFFFYRFLLPHPRARLHSLLYRRDAPFPGSGPVYVRCVCSHPRTAIVEFHFERFDDASRKIVISFYWERKKSKTHTGWHIRLWQTSLWHEKTVPFWPGLAWPGQNGTFAMMSTGGSPQPDVSPCKNSPELIIVFIAVYLLVELVKILACKQSIF